MNVSFLNLDRIHHRHGKEILDALTPLIENTQFIGGEAVSGFEDAFGAWLGDGIVAAGCGNGTDAITLAASGLGLEEGEAIVPAMTFVATVEALMHAGFSIRLVDVDARTGLMDTEALAEAITPKTRLLVPVHLYGQMVPMDEVRRLADKHNLKILEDSAQAHGATWKGKPPSYFGDVATFSFFPGKNLGAWGDAGAVVSRNASLIERCSALGKHGGLKKYHHDFLGWNSRLDSLQAAILTVKLKYLSGWNERRRELARKYDERFGKLPGVETTHVRPDAVPVHHLYVVRVDDREGFQKFLQERGVSTGIHYPAAIHQLPAFRGRDFTKGAYPNAERFAADGVSLPMCPFMTDEEAEWVCTTVEQWSRTR